MSGGTPTSRHDQTRAALIEVYQILAGAARRAKAEQAAKDEHTASPVVQTTPVTDPADGSRCRQTVVPGPLA
jgi:hypothetical protein